MKTSGFYFLALRRISLFILFLFSIDHILYGQVDVRNYATDDLFKIKPVVDQSTFTVEKETEKQSYLEVEFEKGLNYLENNEIEEALFHFSHLHDEYPEVELFPFYIGNIHYQEGQYEKAKEAYNETLVINSLFLEARYMLGLVYIAQQKLKEAKDLFEILSGVPNYETVGTYGLALTHIEKGWYLRAYKLMKKCIEYDSTFTDVYPYIVNYDLAYDNIRSALRILNEGVENNPEWEQGIMMRAIVSAMESNSIEQFEEDIKRLQLIDPTNYNYLAIHGFLLKELGKYSEAVKAFYEAISLEENQSEKKYKFESKMAIKDSYLKALRYYFEHYGMDIEQRNYLDKAICELMIDNKKEAIKLLDSASSHSNNSVISTFKGVVLLEQSRNLQAIEQLSQAFEIDTLNWTALHYRSETLLQERNFQKALEDLNILVKLNPYLMEAYKNRAEIYSLSGYHKRAYLDYARAMAIDPDNYDMIYNRAVTSFKMKFYEESLKDLQMILNVKNDGYAYYLKYQCEMTLGDTTDAVSSLDSASKYIKYEYKIHNELLDLASKMQIPESQINAHNRLVKYYPYKLKYKLNRAKYHYFKSDVEEAQKELEKLIKERRNISDYIFVGSTQDNDELIFAEAYYYLGIIESETGDQNVANRHFKKAEKLGFVKQ